MRQLVDAEPSARPAGALGIVEDEIIRTDVAVDEVMRRAAQSLVETRSVRLGRPLGLPLPPINDVHLEQPVADEQRRRDAGLDGFLVLATDDEAVDDGVHVVDVGCLEGGFFRKVDALSVNDQAAAALLADLGEDEVEVLAVDLEDWRPQLDLGALGQRQNRLENLARGTARRGLTTSWAMGLPDGSEQQVEVTRDVGHRPDRRARVVGEGFLLDRNDRRQPEDEVDIGLGDMRDEALRKRGERLHVAALALGVDGVERQARLA